MKSIYGKIYNLILTCKIFMPFGSILLKFDIPRRYNVATIPNDFNTKKNVHSEVTHVFKREITYT